MFTIRMKILLTIFLSLMIAMPASAENKPIPPQLETWKSWVLNGLDEQLCPTTYNNGGLYRCNWSSRLKLSAEPKQGAFEQQWLIHVKGWVALPGSAEIWPLQVKVNGEDTPVMSRNNTPSIYLLPGEYRVTGVFEWNDIPEMMRIPPSVGLVTLSINGRITDSPVLDKQGQLWLQKRSQSAKQEDMQEVAVYRLITDQIPMEITTHLQLNISGQAREIRLSGVLLKGSVPMRLESPLPVRLGHGDLQIQARPGQWNIRIAARLEEPAAKIGPVSAVFGDEIWSFKSQNHLRMVEIEGVTPIEPKQTDNPSDWKEFPAYVVKADSTLQFKELRRGDPDPAPDRLSLQRTFWLDFDGQGFTIQDKIYGTMSRQWYLAMNQPGLLGRVSVDSADQLITMYGDDKKAGVQLRRGQLDLMADSRFEASSRSIPAVGWDHDFQSLSGKLNLPPGWRLLAAQGADIVPGTWFQRWTLLDFFMVLIIGLGASKLRDKRWGILALITMILIYHETGSPRFVWLNILAALGLLKVLPDGWARKLVRLWGFVAVTVLIVLSIPFMVHQIRWGIYPQLENIDMYSGTDFGIRKKAVKSDMPPSVDRGYSLKQEAMKPAAPMQNQMQDNRYQRNQAIFANDPNALIQTGPGLPEWHWRAIDLKWNGPVDKTQELRLWLLSPAMNLMLAFIRVCLLALLIYGILNIRYWRKTFNQKISVATVMILFISHFALCTLHFSLASAQEYPPPELLKELQQRLLEKPDCLPNCADCSAMELTASPESVQILLKIHAAVETAIPLPGNSESWVPEQVFINQIPAKGLAKDTEGGLWMLIPKGVHQVSLIGRTGNKNEIQIPLPLKPKQAKITAQGWDIQGVHPDGKTESSVQMTRLQKSDQNKSDTSSIVFPPFLHVERVLHLGLTWQVSTMITRLTPIGTPVVVSVPLIEGESVTTSGIRVEKNQALVNMDSKTAELSWTSTLKMATEIRLQSPTSVPWTETWILDASPIWHCDLSGIAVIHHQDSEGLWRPTWKPWSGEQVSIKISQPQAISGQLTTIDSAQLTLTPGERFDKADLSLQLRTSRGGQHDILLPETAVLQLVKINDKSQPIRQEGRKVVIPLQPGNQKIHLEWHQPGASPFRVKAPLIHIGEQAVNAKVTIQMPRNRWILWASGPVLGPAVLFWSYLFVVIIIAFGLGKISLTPLKTHQWLLLSLGLTQVHPLAALMIVGWFLALGFRKQNIPPDQWFKFNCTQLVLTGWTLAAMIGFYVAIEAGLLGIPQMQISGNGSSDYHLYWIQDRIKGVMPQPVVFSLPLLVYRCLMLIWALWLAMSLLQWLKWGWSCFSEGKIWRKRTSAKKEQVQA